MTLNVVVVCDYGHAVGGAEKVAIESAVGLASAGVRVHFVAGAGPIDPALERGGIEVHLGGVQELRRKGRIELATSGLWDLRCARMAEQLLTDLPRGRTIVHLHSWQRALTAAVLRACTRSGHPLLLTLHEYGLACPNQGFYDYQQHRICARRALGPACLVTHCDTRTYAHKLWRTSRTLLQRSACGVPSRLRDVIFLSELSRSRLSPYLPSDTRWHAVRNPISAVKEARVCAEANREFLFVGRVSTEKGAELFARAASSARVKATIAGDGPVLSALRSAHPGMTFLGWLSPDQVQHALRLARALVFPSLWYEGQPLVVQEALAAGVPVIAADGTSAREAVRDGHNGVSFAHQSSAALAARLVQLERDDALIAHLSEGAYRGFWADPPTLERHVEALQDVYRQCLTAAA